MKFTITILAFFGTLAIGQSKPTVSILGDGYQNIYYFGGDESDDEVKVLEPYYATSTAISYDTISTTVSTQDESTTTKPSIPSTNAEDFPTSTAESENSDYNKPTTLLIPISEKTFYYVSYVEYRVVETLTVESMDELSQFCNRQGGKRAVHIFEEFEDDDDPHHVYFTCEFVDENTDMVPEDTTTEDTHDETTTFQPNIPTTNTEDFLTPTTESENLVQNYKVSEPKIYYVFDYGTDREMPVLAPVDGMFDITPFCENPVIWDGEKRKVKIIERDDDTSNVYFVCESSEKDTDVSATVPTSEDTQNEPITPTESTPIQTTESGNSEATVAPYRYIGEGYEYFSSVDAWMKLHDKPESWSDARLRCLHEGSTLASPIDSAMLEVMKGFLGNKLSVAFTGISDDYAPGYFYSVEGVSLDDIPAAFVPGAPDFTQDSDGCIGMYPNGTLTMLRCNTPKPFICYVKDSDVPEIRSPCGLDPDYVYESRTGKCYKFHTFGKTWSSAFMTCATEGGHLAIINSDVEAQALVDLVNKFPESAVRSDYPGITLLGFRDWSEHTTWMTIHGQTLQKAGYSRWGPGEPSDPRSESCGSMFRDGELNDTLCHSPMPFVCEKKPAVPPKEGKSDSDGTYTTTAASLNQ